MTMAINSPCKGGDPWQLLRKQRLSLQRQSQQNQLKKARKAQNSFSSLNINRTQ